MALPSMYDAVNPASIPAGVPAPDYWLGYVDGHWPSYDAGRAQFPSAVPVAISAIPGSPSASTAQGCDGEEGDYTPSQAAHFAAGKLVLGRVPFIYCSFAAWHDYQVACSAIGVNPNDVDWGIAAYPGIGPELYPGSVFHQFVDHGAYDQSVVAPGWAPGRPVATAPSQPPEEAPMPVSQAVSYTPGEIDVFQVSFATLWHKRLTAAGWTNEALTGPFGVVEPARATSLPPQSPQVAVLGNQCTVTVEDTAGKVWYFAQTAGSKQWGVNELP